MVATTDVFMGFSFFTPLSHRFLVLPVLCLHKTYDCPGVIDAQSIPFARWSFDAVIANSMLYHVPDRARALAEIQRILKPSGRFYASTIGEQHPHTPMTTAVSQSQTAAPLITLLCKPKTSTHPKSSSCPLPKHR